MDETLHEHTSAFILLPWKQSIQTGVRRMHWHHLAALSVNAIPRLSAKYIRHHFERRMPTPWSASQEESKWSVETYKAHKSSFWKQMSRLKLDTKRKKFDGTFEGSLNIEFDQQNHQCSNCFSWYWCQQQWMVKPAFMEEGIQPWCLCWDPLIRTQFNGDLRCWRV